MSPELQKCIQAVNSIKQTMVRVMGDGRETVKYYNAHNLATEVADVGTPDPISTNPPMSKQEFLDSLNFMASCGFLLFNDNDGAGHTLLGTAALSQADIIAYKDKLAI